MLSYSGLLQQQTPSVFPGGANPAVGGSPPPGLLSYFLYVNRLQCNMPSCSCLFQQQAPSTPPRGEPARRRHPGRAGPPGRSCGAGGRRRRGRRFVMAAQKKRRGGRCAAATLGCKNPIGQNEAFLMKTSKKVFFGGPSIIRRAFPLRFLSVGTLGVRRLRRNAGKCRTSAVPLRQRRSREAESIVFGFDAEVCLRMLAHGADFRRFLADDDVAAVAALPDGDVVADKHGGRPRPWKAAFCTAPRVPFRCCRPFQRGRRSS